MLDSMAGATELPRGVGLPMVYVKGYNGKVTEKRNDKSRSGILPFGLIPVFVGSIL